jgi:hypothetical protein
MERVRDRKRSPWAALALVLCCAACGQRSTFSDGGPRDAAMPSTDDGGGPPPPVFTVEQVTGCGQAGYSTQLVVGAGKVALVTMATNPMMTDCPLAGQPCGADGILSSCPAQVANFDICYAESVGGAPFTTQIVTTQPYVAAMGMGMALDPSGNPWIVYPGGGPGAKRCGATQLELVKASGGKFGAPITVATSSKSTALVPDAMQTACTSNWANLPGYCNTGDAVGYWPAITFDAMGNAQIAYRDIHYGVPTPPNDTDMDAVGDTQGAIDFALSDVEYVTGPTFTNTLTVDIGRGGGNYIRMQHTPDGRIAIVHFNLDGWQPDPMGILQPGIVNGIYINHILPDGKTWQAVQINGAIIGEAASIGGPSATNTPIGLYYGPGDCQQPACLIPQQALSFAIAPNGLHMIAYSDALEPSLAIAVPMSPDGVGDWFPPQVVDDDGITGEYPSLAFGPNGPAISYYRCNVHDITDQSCNAFNDGLYLARKTETGWTRDNLSRRADQYDGMYTQLAFDNGKMVIAYQTRDAVSGNVVLNIAREQ